MEYTQLQPKVQRQIVEERLLAFERSHLAATIDEAAARASGENDQADGFASQIQKWEQAADAAREILTAMPAPDAKAAPARRRSR